MRGHSRRSREDGARRPRRDSRPDVRDGRHRAFWLWAIVRFVARRGERVDVRVRVAVGLAAARRTRRARLERRDLHGAGRGDRRDGVARRSGRGGSARTWRGSGSRCYRRWPARSFGGIFGRASGVAGKPVSSSRCRALRTGHSASSTGRVARVPLRPAGVRLHHHGDLPAGHRATRVAGIALARPVLADVRRGADRRAR